MNTLLENVRLTKIECGNCGAPYAISECYRAHKQEIGTSWNCPYCQTGWGYTGNGLNQQLKKQLEEKERELRASKCETMAEKNARESAERKLKRIGKGVCPCCNRAFLNIQRHMLSKHPGFAKT